VRWAVGAPVAAAAGVIFFARAWAVPWHGYSVAAVAVSAWILGVVSRWGDLREGRERLGAKVALGAAAALVLYWAGWLLPRGLVLTALPLAALAGQAALWRRGGRVRFHAGASRWVRSLAFAAGVWLPLVWWHPGALLREFLRWDNAAFLVLVVMVGWSRDEMAAGRPASERRESMRWALGLAATAFVGWWLSGYAGMAAPSAVYSGVAAGALALAALLGWGRIWGKAAAIGWWPEVCLVAMLLTTWGR
jgi:hypothetical protein